MEEQPTWFQVSLRQERPGGYYAEQVVWRHKPKVGDQVGDMTVALVYGGLGCKNCPHCGQRLRYPDSRAHVRIDGKCN